MAEFKDVIKQQKRMCDAMENCGRCPLIDADCACRFSCMIEGNFDSAETEMIGHIIMGWAAKHPEPRYPSWSETWRRLFPDARYTPCPESEFGIKMKCKGGCKECLDKPIPADIAEKLGIKLVGGEVHEE